MPRILAPQTVLVATVLFATAEAFAADEFVCTLSKRVVSATNGDGDCTREEQTICFEQNLVSVGTKDSVLHPSVNFSLG